MNDGQITEYMNEEGIIIEQLLPVYVPIRWYASFDTGIYIFAAPDGITYIPSNT